MIWLVHSLAENRMELVLKLPHQEWNQTCHSWRQKHVWFVDNRQQLINESKQNFHLKVWVYYPEETALRGHYLLSVLCSITDPLYVHHVEFSFSVLKRYFPMMQICGWQHEASVPQARQGVQQRGQPKKYKDAAIVFNRGSKNDWNIYKSRPSSNKPGGDQMLVEDESGWEEGFPFPVSNQDINGKHHWRNCESILKWLSKMLNAFCIFL